MQKRLDREFLSLLLGNSDLFLFANGKLTDGGVQWSDEVTTTDGEWTPVETAEVDLGTAAKIVVVKIKANLQLKSSNVNNYCKFKWQARNKNGTWVDLFDEVTYPADASSYALYRYEGYFKIESNFNKVPFEIRAVVKRENQEENVTAQVKNTSYVNVIIDPRTQVEEQ
jgi:hypothetical protein